MDEAEGAAGIIVPHNGEAGRAAIVLLRDDTLAPEAYRLQVNRSGVTALVLCTFSESQAPSVGNPDSFWTVDLKRQPDERWLITNYGQG